MINIVNYENENGDIISVAGNDLSIKLESTQHGRMPILKFTTHIDGEERRLFLSPFRGYKFQLSATIDGEYDCGSSVVLGLGNIMNAINEYTKDDSGNSSLCSNVSWKHNKSRVIEELFLGQILICLTSQTSSNFIRDYIAKFGKSEYEIIYNFIGRCIAYISSILEEAK